MGNKEFRDLMINEREKIISASGIDKWGKYRIDQEEATAIATVDALRAISHSLATKNVSVEDQNKINNGISKRIQRISKSSWYSSGMEKMTQSNWAPEETV